MSATLSRTPSRKRSRAKPPEHRKRSRYVAKACSMCKKRKTKCDGNLPCDLCRHYSLDCRYGDGDEATTVVAGRDSRHVDDGRERLSLGSVDPEHLITLIFKLQGQVNSLEERLSGADCQPVTSREKDDSSPRTQPSGSLAANQPLTPPLVFCGPTSANYGFGIVQVMLQPETDSSRIVAKSNTELAGSIIETEGEYLTPSTSIPLESLTGLDVLRSLEFEEALRLLDVYYTVVGVLHPILDVRQLQTQTKALWQKMEGSGDGNDYLPSADEVDCLKMVLAIALLAEGGGHHDSAIELHESVQTSIVQKLLGTKFHLQDQILLLLVGTYHLFHEDYRMASRIIALAVRLIMEAGLHRRAILMHRFPDPSERKQAVIVLYTTIVLDRQLCFAAGLPYILKDPDVDLPNSDGGPYLQAMSSYIRIGAQLWESLLDSRGKLKTAFKDEDFDFMEYQVQRWQQALPEELRPEHVPASLQGNQLKVTSGSTIFSMRILLYLRANQIRILVLRPILFSTQTASTHQRRIESLINVARDNIEKLVQVDHTSDVYRKQQPFHNHFLASALSALFLVVAHQSRDAAYRPQTEAGPYSCAAVRETIFKALDLIKSYSSLSRSCRRLLHSIDGPRGLLMRLGLLRRDECQSVTDSQRTTSPAFAIPYTPAQTPGDPEGAQNPAELRIQGDIQSQLAPQSMTDTLDWISPTADLCSGDMSLTTTFFPTSVDFGKEVNFLFDNFL